jgi:hypothetical protein
MKNRFVKCAFLVLALVLTVVLAFTLVSKPDQQAQSRNTIALQAPPFVGQALAEEDGPEAFDLGAYLDQEAGISAYFQASPITLSMVRGLFRTIEMETADYIIGSIPASGYYEHFDVHVYIHKDGWILAYYLKQDPVAKIVDIKANTITTTKLKNVVSQVAATAGSAFSDVTYYDFRFPTATNMMLVFEDDANGFDYSILLPSAYGYFERSYTDTWYFKVDNVELTPSYNDNGIEYGFITAGQLMPDVTHNIVARYSSVLAIVYRVP